MAEPSAAAQSGVAASERDVLLATKLHVPRLHPGFVPRPRLVDALDGGLVRRLILVGAPAGFGKTALLADWARSGNWPMAWWRVPASSAPGAGGCRGRPGPESTKARLAP